VRYENLKKQDREWQKVIEFIFGSFDNPSYDYAKAQTTFKKMREKNKKDVPDNLKFYRRGGSNYINELPKDQQDILLNWPGYRDLNKRIHEN
jgi:hypothetical protein